MYLQCHTQYYVPGTTYDLPGTTHTIYMCLQYSYCGPVSSLLGTGTPMVPATQAIPKPTAPVGPTTYIPCGWKTLACSTRALRRLTYKVPATRCHVLHHPMTTGTWKSVLSESSNLQFWTLDPQNCKEHFSGWSAQALSDLVYNFEHWTHKIITNSHQADCTSLNCTCLRFQASNPQNRKE